MFCTVFFERAHKITYTYFSYNGKNNNNSGGAQFNPSATAASSSETPVRIISYSSSSINSTEAANCLTPDHQQHQQ